ncbi:hypothetical protein FACS1894169_12230 [Bacteroidia bacterium]|nr:hypothetical protein FACS1894169_12230 [Bacteroidia bacterium]
MDLGKLDLYQDTLAVKDALTGWWKESMKNNLERMSWFNDAKFGCFIHWGVYSVPAGIWKGRKIGGYTEHLMRQARIPLETYKRELVYPFNPSEFDADEWVQNAVNAGMKYFIITAKHHDGFALYPSDAYPYDIRMSQFKRDPMKELRDAARKHGIKFGFYYSHAFDWEHPDAPGNDWDYDNPGGDKLLHGANWWLNFPEFLPHAKKYVSEKSIPQIIELIKKYNPDILWFDTPHKLPLYENIRILQAIRENDNETKIVVNGRLARYSITQYGDYKSTADRAAFFPPEEGCWESIPTTNESYGYSKVDFSHKPVSYFVRLLASATAKGGNILMNVGPMGNGKWDDTDVKIFQGVGNWLKVYGKAIYGNEKTDLPIQQWGVTTKKEDTLYLHIFHWPKDGNIVVGGLTSDIEKGWIVSDNRAKPLNIKRIDSKDLSIKLPSIAPDTTSTVIALKVKKENKPYPIRLLTPDCENTLLVFDSQRIGEGLGFGDGKYSRNYVAGWKNNDQYMQWDLRISRSTEFDIYIDYNTESAKDSGIVTIQIADNLYNVNYTPLSGWGKINTIHAGKIKLRKGEFKGTLKGIEYEGTQYMRPIAIRLVPINSK